MHAAGSITVSAPLPPPSLSVFLSELGAGQERSMPPVHLWNPERCTDEGDFRIRADGVWLHQGSPIGRETLVRLFASILRKDADGETYLVTPGEKVRVRVDDAPFLGVRVDRFGEGMTQTIAVTTNIGDVATVGAEGPLRLSFDPATGEPRPYVLIRGRLEARLLRAPYYELAEWAVEHKGRSGVWSGGEFFALEAQP
jgi:hypothetical protein